MLRDPGDVNAGGDLGKRSARQVGVLATCDCSARPSGRPLMINSVSRRWHRRILLATFSRPSAAFPQLMSPFQATRRRNLGLNRFPTRVRLLPAGLPLRGSGSRDGDGSVAAGTGSSRGAGQWPGGARSGAGLPFSPLMAPGGWMRPRGRSSPAAARRIRGSMSSHTPLICSPLLGEQRGLAALPDDHEQSRTVVVGPGARFRRAGTAPTRADSYQKPSVPYGRRLSTTTRIITRGSSSDQEQAGR